MYGGYYGGWVPEDYITEDIPIQISMKVRKGDPTCILITGQKLNGLRKQKEMNS